MSSNDICLRLSQLFVYNFRSAKDAFVAPVATGMGVALCLMALKRQRPGSKYVIWSRVDQKSCFKAILTAGLEPVIMSLVKAGDELRTGTYICLKSLKCNNFLYCVFTISFFFSDTHSIEDVVSQHGGPEAICAIVTATSVFAPRVADDVPAGKEKNAHAMPVRCTCDAHLTYYIAIHFIIWVADSLLALVLGLSRKY